MDNTITNAQTIGAKIKLRLVTPEDLDLLRHWDEQPHVKAAVPDDDWAWEEELKRTPEWRELLIAEFEGRAIGFTQIIDPQLEDSHYWGEVASNLRAIDIWIGEADALGQGHGTQIMQLAIAKCFADSGVTAILIDPLKTNVAAQRFYKRMGFKFVEDRCFTDVTCSVYQLRRETWQGMNAVKPILAEDRRVANIHDTEFRRWESEHGEATGESLIQINSSKTDGVGFHIYRMAPGTTTTPHIHTEDEEFYVIEGELSDNDGTVYRAGDLVWLKKNTEHYSYSENGCTLVVYIKTAEVAV